MILKALKKELLNSTGRFTWDFGQHFFVETSIGNFVWSDPQYNGNNTFERYVGSFEDWLKEIDIPFGRDKGEHFISSFCGDQFTVILNKK